MATINAGTLLQQGWLSRQPVDFQTAILVAGRVRTFAKGETVFSIGSEPGGIFGILSASVAVVFATDHSDLHIGHIARPGDWFGEGSFLTGQPRRVGLQAQSDCSLFQVPLDAMERLAAADPMVARRFGQIAMANIDLALRVIGELMIADVNRRLAAFLLRATASGAAPLLLTQAQIGDMANTSRKAVNTVLSHFADQGWIETGYASIIVRNPDALRRLALAD